MESKCHKRKEVKTMKYDTPEIMVLMPAINAIQTAKATSGSDAPNSKEPPAAYEDWED